jgi:DNA-binding MarR family transcriptional regulator
MPSEDLEPADYRALADFRYRIRRFLQFSEAAARREGLEPQQHQLLLAVKGLPEAATPTIGELARRLLLKHHSTVELVNRMEHHGLVVRHRNPDDARQVLIRPTPEGEAILGRLSAAHRAELEATGPELVRLLKGAMRQSRRNASAA